VPFRPRRPAVLLASPLRHTPRCRLLLLLPRKSRLRGRRPNADANGRLPLADAWFWNDNGFARQKSRANPFFFVGLRTPSAASLPVSETVTLRL